MKEKRNQNHTGIRNVSKCEAAQMLGVSIRTVENLIYKRLIDHVRIGTRVLIPYSSLERYNENSTIPAYEAGSERIA